MTDCFRLDLSVACTQSRYVQAGMPGAEPSTCEVLLRLFLAQALVLCGSPQLVGRFELSRQASLLSLFTPILLSPLAASFLGWDPKLVPIAVQVIVLCFPGRGPGHRRPGPATPHALMPDGARCGSCMRSGTLRWLRLSDQDALRKSQIAKHLNR